MKEAEQWLSCETLFLITFSNQLCATNRKHTDAMVLQLSWRKADWNMCNTVPHTPFASMSSPAVHTERKVFFSFASKIKLYKVHNNQLFKIITQADITFNNSTISVVWSFLSLCVIWYIFFQKKTFYWITSLWALYKNKIGFIAGKTSTRLSFTDLL